MRIKRKHISLIATFVFAFGFPGGYSPATAAPLTFAEVTANEQAAAAAQASQQKAAVAAQAAAAAQAAQQKAVTAAQAVAVAQAAQKNAEEALVAPAAAQAFMVSEAGQAEERARQAAYQPIYLANQSRESALIVSWRSAYNSCYAETTNQRSRPESKCYLQAALEAQISQIRSVDAAYAKETMAYDARRRAIYEPYQAAVNAVNASKLLVQQKVSASAQAAVAAAAA